MPLIRKERAGSDSHGHTWPKDGAVVEVEDAGQAAALLAIPDGGFSEVTPETRRSGSASGADDRAPSEFGEVDPRAEDVEAPKSTGRRSRRPAVQE
ncbi:hypothetical protein [Streptomyces triculaminicus]|uniref:hypothetical protein n=1 Tax=Streptomyces triculaminicus TaxID=2816232 RepID=UPI00378891CF